MDNIKTYVQQHKDRFLAELIELLKIPSVSADTAYTQDVIDTANAPVENLNAMVAAMASFCINDAFIKELSTRVPIGELIAVRGVFAILLLLAVLPWLGLRVGWPERFSWLRAAGEAAVTFAFLAALARLPIGDTYTLYFAGPLLLTAGAALFLGERVSPRRWGAVVVGFLGVLVVLGVPANWQAASLIALAAALLSVARDLVTRWIAQLEELRIWASEHDLPPLGTFNELAPNIVDIASAAIHPKKAVRSFVFDLSQQEGIPALQSTFNSDSAHGLPDVKSFRRTVSTMRKSYLGVESAQPKPAGYAAATNPAYPN